MHSHIHLVKERQTAPFHELPLLYLFKEANNLFSMPPFSLTPQAFCIFSGLGLNNASMYLQVSRAMARQAVAFEVRKSEEEAYIVLADEYHKGRAVYTCTSFSGDDPIAFPDPFELFFQALAYHATSTPRDVQLFSVRRLGLYKIIGKQFGVER
jgi:hypothetical protein